MSGSDLLTSTEAARILGVAPSSVKRWADEGLLACSKTPGRHRRFRRSDVERFAARERGGHGGELIGLDAWMESLLAPASAHALHARLLEARVRLGSWWSAADEVGAVLVELGRRWESGVISVLQEHVASEQLARAVARCAEALPVSPTAPRALLAVPEGEEHTLGLALAELCLVEAGWFARWAGRRTPVAEIVAAVAADQVELVAASASVCFTNAARLAEFIATVGPPCDEKRVALVMGGEAPWPEPPAYGTRVHTFSELHDIVVGRRR